MSLPEVMISMVILLFVALALVQTVTLTMDVNMKAAVLAQAVNIGEENMSRTRDIALGAYPACPATNTVSGTVTNSVRNAWINYYITNTGCAATTTSAQDVTGTVLNPTGQVTIINTLVEWQWPLGQGSAPCKYAGPPTSMVGQQCYSHLLTIVRSQ